MSSRSKQRGNEVQSCQAENEGLSWTAILHPAFNVNRTLPLSTIRGKGIIKI